MFILKSLVLASLVSLLAGCSSTAKSSGTTVNAVACDKCKVTWVNQPIESKNRVVGYQSVKSMICPDCKSAAENFFSTGKLEHACKSCGPDAMKTCEMH